jgi:hypothetical protein
MSKNIKAIASKSYEYYITAQSYWLRLKCDGTRTETRFRLSVKRTSLMKSAGASVQSTISRRAVQISLQGLYCSCKPVFCSNVMLTGYPLHSRFPFTSPPVHHHVPSHFNWTLTVKFKSTGIIDVHSTRLCISSTTASHTVITHNYFSNTVLDIQDTQRSAFMQEEVLKLHKQKQHKDCTK